jgi:hypothetical protein
MIIRYLTPSPSPAERGIFNSRTPLSAGEGRVRLSFTYRKIKFNYFMVFISIKYLHLS